MYLQGLATVGSSRGILFHGLLLAEIAEVPKAGHAVASTEAQARLDEAFEPDRHRQRHQEARNGGRIEREEGPAKDGGPGDAQNAELPTPSTISAGPMLQTPG